MNYQSARGQSADLHPPPVAADPIPLKSMEEVVDFARTCRVDPRIQAVVPRFDAPFFQAGLAGYSDAAMRIVARRHGCPYCMTESILDRLLLQGGKSRMKIDLEVIRDNVPGGEEDHPLAGQVIGSLPDEMAEAAAMLAGFGFDVIDVNLACPVKKMGRKCRGGHFLAHPEDAIDVLKAVRDAVPKNVPTTVKLRRGADDDDADSDSNFERIFDALYELGYAWATVHGRTVKQKYNGPSNWDALRDLVQRFPDRIIFGSGDIWSAEYIFRMIAYTGVSAVSVARGCIGNPWIFRQARQLMAGELPTLPTLHEQRETLILHFKLCCAEHGERMAGRLMRKFGIKFSQHHPQPDVVRNEFIRVKNLADWERAIDTHYGRGGLKRASPADAVAGAAY